MYIFLQFSRDMKAGRLIILSFLFSLISTITLQAQTANISEGCLPLEVDFTAPGGSSSFFWDFQDGATSTQQNPGHIFATPGTFVVEFRETAGGAIIGTVTITVFNAPEIMITSDPSGGCAPLVVQFGDSSVVDVGLPITGFQWVFGDNSAPETVQHPTHTYANVGVYTVSLNLVSPLPNCTTTEIFQDEITVTEQPDVSFTTNPDPATACVAPLGVSFTNTSPNASNLTFEWDFGNGNTSTETNPFLAQNYVADGIYTVSLTGTNSDGCSRTVTQLVSIGSPLASFNVPDTVCLGSLVQLDNTSSSGSYNWTFGPGIFPGSSTQRDPIVRIDQTGVLSISLTVTSPDGNCSADTTILVFSEEADASFTATPDYSCSEPFDVTFTPNATDAATYEWSFGDDSTSMMQMPTHTYANLDTTTFSKNGRLEFITTLTVTTSGGCTAESMDTITLFQPNALFMPDTTRGCAPLTVMFSDSSSSNEDIVSWEWIYGTAGSELVTNGDPRTFTFNTPGEYDVVLVITNSAGCRDTSYAVQILVGDNIVPDFTVDQTAVCPGDTVVFNDITNNPNIDEWHFETDDGRSFHCADEDELMWVFATETGTMDVTLTVGYNGCYSSTTRDDIIQVNGPIAHIDYQVECDAPFDFVFRDSSDDATSIIWDFGDGTPVSTMPDSVLHTYADTGVYTVYLTAENNVSGCPASIDSVEVHVRDLMASFFIGESPTDTFLCQGEEYDLNAMMSVDVDADCWRGFTYYFDDTRPITTQDSIIPRVFNQPGRQTVRLVAMDINGCLDTAEVRVGVYRVTPDFELDKPRICLPSTVNFLDLSVGDTTIASIEWDLGNGLMSSASNPSATYTDASIMGNSIIVSVTATDVVGCGGTAMDTITIYEPVSTIQASDNIICEGEMINFAASDFTQEGSFLNFDWNFDNGEVGMAQFDTITYTMPGNYTVTLNYTEDSTGCMGSTTTDIEVQEFPVASFISNFDNEPFICHPQQFLLNSTTQSPHGLNYNWSLDGQSLGSEAAFAASLGKGTFDIELIVSTVGGGCMDTISRSYTLVGPEGDFDLDPTIICKGEDATVTLRDTVDITSFTWDFGDGTLVNNTDPATHTFNDANPPSTAVTLILRGINDACEFAVQKQLQIRDVTADFSTDVTCIDGVNFINNSTGADTYDWTFGDGGTSTAENPSYVYGMSGPFIVSLAVLNTQFNCRDTLTQEINVSDLPTPMASGNNACEGGVSNLMTGNPIPGNTYQWTSLGANTLVNPNQANTATNPLSGSGSNSFVLTETNPEGCIGRDTATILITAAANDVVFDTTICANPEVFTPFTIPVQFDEDSYTIEWTSDSINIQEFGLSCLDCPNPTVGSNGAPPSGTLIGNIMADPSSGCDDAQAIISINSLNPGVDIPNAFTPDADGTNDFFNVIVADNRVDLLNIKRFQIFNRWGQVVYNNEEPLRGWSGMFKGKPAPSDVYVYVIEMDAAGVENCPVEKLVGDVSLIR